MQEPVSLVQRRTVDNEIVLETCRCVVRRSEDMYGAMFYSLPAWMRGMNDLRRSGKEDNTRRRPGLRD